MRSSNGASPRICRRWLRKVVFLGATAFLMYGGLFAFAFYGG